MLQASFSLATLSSSTVGPQGDSRPAGVCNPLSKSMVYLRAFAQMDLPSAPGGSRPDQMPEPQQLALFDSKKKKLYSKLPLDVRGSHSISKAKPSYFL